MILLYYLLRLKYRAAFANFHADFVRFFVFVFVFVQTLTVLRTLKQLILLYDYFTTA